MKILVIMDRLMVDDETYLVTEGSKVSGCEFLAWPMEISIILLSSRFSEKFLQLPFSYILHYQIGWL